jgi:hypothetical protein
VSRDGPNATKSSPTLTDAALAKYSPGFSLIFEEAI